AAGSRSQELCGGGVWFDKALQLPSHYERFRFWQQQTLRIVLSCQCEPSLGGRLVPVFCFSNCQVARAERLTPRLYVLVDCVSQEGFPFVRPTHFHKNTASGSLEVRLPRHPLHRFFRKAICFSEILRAPNVQRLPRQIV